VVPGPETCRHRRRRKHELDAARAVERNRAQLVETKCRRGADRDGDDSIGAPTPDPFRAFEVESDVDVDTASRQRADRAIDGGHPGSCDGAGRIGIGRPHRRPLGPEYFAESPQQPRIVVVTSDATDQANFGRNRPLRHSAARRSAGPSERELRQNRQRPLSELFRLRTRPRDAGVVYQPQVVLDRGIRGPQRKRGSDQTLGLVEILLPELDHAKHVQRVVSIGRTRENLAIVACRFVEAPGGLVVQRRFHQDAACVPGSGVEVPPFRTRRTVDRAHRRGGHGSDRRAAERSMTLLVAKPAAACTRGVAR